MRIGFVGKSCALAAVELSAIPIEATSVSSDFMVSPPGSADPASYSTRLGPSCLRLFIVEVQALLIHALALCLLYQLEGLKPE
jgi:hypothetical protein